MSDDQESSYGCNNPYCNCRYEGNAVWPLAPVYAVRTTKVEGETKGKAGAGGVTSSDLNRKEGVLSQEELLEEMASNKELNFNRKDDSVHQRVQQVAAGRRQQFSELLLSDGPKKADSQDSDSDDSNSYDTRRPTSIASYEDDAFFLQAFDKEEVEKTCVVALATVNDIRETTGDNIKQEMRDYLQQVFNFPSEKVKELIAKAVDEQETPELCLTVTVVSGTSLTSKDSNGKSDPYCRLGILQEAHMNKSVVKEKDLEVWQKEGLVVEIKATSIKQATLEPEWNENIELSITDPKKEVLVLEVWDSDAEEVQQSSQIKGIKGFGHFLSDLRKGVDDFMGRSFYPLVSIPVHGESKTFTLHSHSGKTKHGYISVSLSVRGIKKNTPLKVSVWEHTMLIRALVNSCSRRGNVYIRRWDGKLAHNAEKLLEQHALLNGLNELQLVAIRFSVLLKYHKFYAISMATMYSLLVQIRQQKGLLPKDITPRELVDGRGGSSLEWLGQLFTDLIDLEANLEELFRNHLNLYNISKPAELQRFKDTLCAFKELYAFRPFVRLLSEGKESLKELLESCISEAVPVWFSILNAKLLPLTQTPTSNLESLRDLVNESLIFMHKVLKSLDPLFLELGMSYFTLFYVSMDTLLTKEIKSKIMESEASPEVAPITFEIYTSCRAMVKLSQYVTSQDKKAELSLGSSHMWFKNHVKSWISVAITRCKARIQKSIELNQTVTDKIKISTSAIDTMGFIEQVAKFWSDLDWPDASISYSMMVYMVQEMSDLAQFYVEQLYQARIDSYKSLSQFAASDDLCIDLNNMHHIRTQIRQLPDKLDFNKFFKWLETEANLGESAKDIVERVLLNADDDFDNRMKHIVSDFSKRMAPEIRKRVGASLSAPEGTSDMDAVAPLLDYLTTNLQTLVDSTYSEVFSCILLPIWNTCVEVIRISLAEELGTKKDANISLNYQRLHTLLDTLTNFFHVGGQGLELSMMQGKDFLDMKAELDFLKLNSEELTQQFFSDLVELQEQVSESGVKEYGDLLLSINYNTSQEAVDVHVIQCRGLPIMDKTGSSDPYVVLTLLPQWQFPDTYKKTFKTHVVKESLDPYFDKEFKIPAKAEDASKKGSILLLTFYDYDLITADDYMGMCVVPLHALPGLPSVPTHSSRLNLTLPLFILTENTKSRAASELSGRAHKGDARAINFFKVNKKILGGDLAKLFKES